MKETTKRQHRRKKTAAEIREEIEALRATLAEREREERERIGAEMQKLTGRVTWGEIALVVEIKGGNNQDAV